MPFFTSRHPAQQPSASLTSSASSSSTARAHPNSSSSSSNITTTPSSRPPAPPTATAPASSKLVPRLFLPSGSSPASLPYSRSSSPPSTNTSPTSSAASSVFEPDAVESEDERGGTLGRKSGASTVASSWHSGFVASAADGGSNAWGEEKTPRGERPPELLSGGAVTASPSSPSYFPRSVSPSNLTPLRSTASSTEPTPQAASSHSPLPSQTTLLLPAHSPGLFLSPLSSPSSLGPPLPTGQPPSSFRRKPSEGHQCNPSVSTSRTSSSSGSFTPSYFSAYSTASTDPSSSFDPSPRSSFCSTSSSSRSSIHSTSSTTSSNASCCLTVDKPIKPAAWPASDLALTKESGKGDGKEFVTDEEILGVETSDDGWVVRVWLPGFSLDSITLATKSRRTLHIIADRWEDANGVHIERKVHFGEDADLRKIKAQFDGAEMKITVPRRTLAISPSRASLSSFPSSSSSSSSTNTSTFASSHYHPSPPSLPRRSTSSWSSEPSPSRASTSSRRPSTADARANSSGEEGSGAGVPDEDAMAARLEKMGLGSKEEFRANVERARAREDGKFTVPSS